MANKESSSPKTLRCNLYINERDNPEIYNALKGVTSKSEEARFLIRLGLMVRNGQMTIGGQSNNNELKPEYNETLEELVDDTKYKSDKSQSKSKTANSDFVELASTDLDFGDDLLSI